MALNNFKCNHLMPLHFKGLKHKIVGKLHKNIKKTVCAVIIKKPVSGSNCNT